MWVGNKTLWYYIFDPLKQEEDKLMVRDIFVKYTWNLEEIFYILLKETFHLILGTPGDITMESKNRQIWFISNSCQYTNVSAYSVLVGHQMNNQNKIIWNWVWKIPTVSKIQYFIWLCLKNRLTTCKLLNHWVAFWVLSTNRVYLLRSILIMFYGGATLEVCWILSLMLSSFV